MEAAGSKKPTITRVFAAKRPGRPPGADPTSERTRKPWLAAGVSERTYRRRKAIAVDAAPKPAEQHGAHVAAWFATLGPIARLEHRALARRCLLALMKPRDRADQIG